MAIETECKIYIENIDQILNRLSQTQAEILIPRVFEQNYRYENLEKTLTPNGIVLRLRQDGDNRITYKSPLPSDTDGIVKRLELETTVGDLDTMNVILQHLGFTRYMSYEKYRTTYHYLDLPNVEIVVDEMPYGNFIEVEGEAAAINDVVKRLNLDHTKRIIESYSDIFDRIRQHQQLSFTDLTFENFANIVVDNTIFK